MKIAMIGFGEAARAFVAGWRSAGRDPAVSAYDIKLVLPDHAAAMRDAMAEAGVVMAASPGMALEDAELAFCLVTADQPDVAAAAAAGHIPAGCLWLDGNSCSPGVKRRAAELISSGFGRYVDMAIMAPVHPPRHRVPLLLSGADAQSAAQRLRPLDMQPEVIGSSVGDASTIKMLRSVMIKGLEALTAECLLAARKAGVEAAVVASLNASDPAIDWQNRGAYNLERMMVHGRRRSAEMREVAATLREIGLPDRMAQAIAEWQQEIGALGLTGGADGLAPRADRILGAFLPR